MSEISAGRAFVTLYLRDKIPEGLAAAQAKFQAFGATLAVAGQVAGQHMDEALTHIAAASNAAASTVTSTTQQYVQMGVVSDDTRRDSAELAKALTQIGRAAESLQRQLARLGDVGAAFERIWRRTITTLKEAPGAIFSLNGAIKTLDRVASVARDAGKWLTRLSIVTRAGGMAVSLGLRGMGLAASAAGKLTRVSLNVVGRVIGAVAGRSTVLRSIADGFKSVGNRAASMGMSIRNGFGKSATEVSRVTKLIGGRMAQLGMGLKAVAIGATTLSGLAKSARLALKAMTALAKAPGAVAKAIAKSPLTITRTALRTPKTLVKATAAVATSAPVKGTAAVAAAGAKAAAATTNAAGNAIARLPGRVAGAVSAIKSRLSSGVASLAKWGVALGAVGALLGAAAAPASAATAAFARQGQVISKLADKTGESVENLSALSHAADRTGVSQEALSKGLAALQGLDTEPLQQIGLAADDLAAKKPAERLDAIATAIAGLKTDAEKAAAANDIFGEAGAEMLPLLEKGGEGIRALREDAERLGLVMTGEQVAAAKTTVEAWDKISTAVKAAYQQFVVAIGSAIAPTLSEWADQVNAMLPAIQAVIREVTDWVGRNRELIVVASTILGVVAGLGGAFVVAGSALGAISTVVGAVGAVLGAIVSPIGLVAGAAIAAGYALIQWAGGFRVIVEKAQALWAQIKPFLDLVTKGVTDALASGNLRLAAEIAWNAVLVTIGEISQRIVDVLGSLLPASSVAFQGIRNALLRGQWAEAADVAWQSVKIIFLRGFAAVQGVWAEFTTGLAMGWDFVVTTIRGAWNGVVSWLAQSIVQLWGSFKGLLDKLAAWDPTGVVAKLSDALDIDAEATVKVLQDDAARQARDRQRALDERNAARAKQLDATLAATQKQIDDLTKARDAAAAKLAGGDDPQAEAMKRLKDAVKQAADGRAALPKKPEVDKLPEAKEEAAKVVTGRGKGVENTGTFSSAAVAFLGGAGGNAQQRTAKATEEMLKEQKATRKAITTIVAPTFAH